MPVTSALLSAGCKKCLQEFLWLSGDLAPWRKEFGGFFFFCLYLFATGLFRYSRNAAAAGGGGVRQGLEQLEKLISVGRFP